MRATRIQNKNYWLRKKNYVMLCGLLNTTVIMCCTSAQIANKGRSKKVLKLFVNQILAEKLLADIKIGKDAMATARRKLCCLYSRPKNVTLKMLDQRRINCVNDLMAPSRFNGDDIFIYECIGCVY